MTLLESDAFPTGMEIFPATDDDAWTLIKRVIDESDCYLLIIAGKYGSVDGGTGLSYTEMEYNYAVSTKKHVMAFLHGDVGKLTSDQCEDTDELRGKLEAFREKVKSAKHVKLWKTPDELAGQVALTYNKFIRQYDAVGWMRADQASSTESLKELVDARDRIDELERELKSVRTTAPAGTEDLAQGADKVSVPFYASAKFRPPDLYTQSAGQWIDQIATWDELLGSVGPLMLQEAEQAELKKGIQKYLRDVHRGDMVEGVVEGAAADGFEVMSDDLSALSAFVSDEVFETMIVQFMALGLIQRSSRNHGVKDTGTYWSLTPFGETRTVQLRALSKGSEVDLGDESESDEDALAAKPAKKRPGRSAAKKSPSKKAHTSS